MQGVREGEGEGEPQAEGAQHTVSRTFSCDWPMSAMKEFTVKKWNAKIAARA